MSEQALLKCVRATRDIAGIQALLTAPDFDWPSFWSLAATQRVQPLVADALSHPTLARALAPDAQHDIKLTRLQTMLHNMSAHAELQAIGTVLNQRGIPILPLKGTCLAQRLFGSLAARRCGDIDILVPEDDWPAARRLLLEHGYQPIAAVRPGVERHAFHGVPLVRVANGQQYLVELHRHLTDPRFMAIDHRALWRSAARPSAGEREFAELPAEALLVFLAIHAPKHANGVLRLFADIDHLIAHEGELMDWDGVVALAKQWRADAMLYFVLRLSQALLSTPVPEDALRRLRPGYWKRALVPLLVDRRAVLRPPMPDHLRANRFRIAYCLMLQPAGRVVRSYWHYIMMPPRSAQEKPHIRVSQALRRPLEGLAWTVIALGSAVRDRVRGSLRGQTESVVSRTPFA